VAMNQTETIEIENVNHPGHVTPVDSDMYEAMKRAFLKVLPKTVAGTVGGRNSKTCDRASARETLTETRTFGVGNVLLCYEAMA
jgi:hypothetical protein